MACAAKAGCGDDRWLRALCSGDENCKGVAGNVKAEGCFIK